MRHLAAELVVLLVVVTVLDVIPPHDLHVQRGFGTETEASRVVREQWHGKGGGGGGWGLLAPAYTACLQSLTCSSRSLCSDFQCRKLTFFKSFDS